MSERVIINDVGPRDGLQNQAKILSPMERAALIQKLIDAGLRDIEIGSFVSPKAVPAMAGTEQVMAELPQGAFNYSALIPNQRGYELAKAAGIGTVSMVVAASTTMNRRNINMRTDEAVAICKELFELGKQDSQKVLAYIATPWECPFEGVMDESRVLDLTEQLLTAGAVEIIYADTIGAASPAQVKSLIGKAVNAFGADKLSCHFHDTRGMGVADVFAALECGIRKFDASIGGLGGCPFAPGASGNVATEDVALMLHQMGFDTGIDLGKLVEAADLAAELTGTSQGGHASRWLKRQIGKGLL